MYALPRSQVVKKILVSDNATVGEALQRSLIQEQFPEIVFEDGKVGIFGKAVKLTQVVKAFDRIEIYRPLINDPKELRRRRAAEAKV